MVLISVDFPQPFRSKNRDMLAHRDRERDGVQSNFFPAADSNFLIFDEWVFDIQ